MYNYGTFLPRWLCLCSYAATTGNATGSAWLLVPGALCENVSLLLVSMRQALLFCCPPEYSRPLTASSCMVPSSRRLVSLLVYLLASFCLARNPPMWVLRADVYRIIVIAVTIPVLLAAPEFCAHLFLKGYSPVDFDPLAALRVPPPHSMSILLRRLVL